MYPFIRFLVWLWFTVTARPQMINAERFPSTGAAILAANHSTAVETVLVPGMVRRQLVHVAKRELFTDRRPFHRLLGRFIYWAGARPVDRTGGRASAHSMAGVLDQLAGGDVVIVFPEGTRAPDDRLYKGKTGVARLALASGAPVIPIGLVYTHRRRVPGWPFPVLWHPELRFGEPLDFSEWRDGVDDSAVLRHVADEVMRAIQKLTGQQYVDVYAASLRSAIADGRDLPTPEQPYPGADRPPPVLRREPTEANPTDASPGEADDE